MANEPTASPFTAASLLKRLLGVSDVLFAAAIIGIITILLLPLPTGILDTMFGISITFSILILMTVLFIEKPLDFSTFPTILLVAALLRLSLNIASTRLILSQGHTGTDAAGHVIEAFGYFVMEGSVIIGAIVFSILTIINFVVITKGSGRIAEVAARFNLDAMPGKQMAIDADLSAGLIDENTAKSRRKELESENTFFGAMDGASKFVRGDAIAGLLITIINFIAGIIIGVVQRDLSFNQALETYTILTIGDGLVSQIPSLIVSLSAGLLVSKSGISGATNKAVFGQLGKFPQALALSASLLVFMSMMPAIPAIPFLSLAFLMGLTAWTIHKKAAAATAIETQEEQATQEALEQEEPISKALQLDAIRLELGYGLLPLINYQKGHKLPDQIKALRKQIARDLGFVMPSIRIQDNMQLSSNCYNIKIKDIACGEGNINPERLLAMDPKGGSINLPGEDTTEPAFGLPAKWIAETHREEAIFNNYTVVDPPTVITTHLTEVIKDNIAELLSHSETQKLVDELPEEHKKLVADLIPAQITITNLQRILQNLLLENISIRDLTTILEALSEATQFTKNITLLTEHVRLRLARQISHANQDDEGNIPILALSPRWEEAFKNSLYGEGEEKQLSMPPSDLQTFIAATNDLLNDMAMKGIIPVILTSAPIRPYVRSLLERFRPKAIIMSQNEIHPKAKIKTVGQL